MAFDSTPLPNEAFLQITTHGRHAHVVINRDDLVEKRDLATATRREAHDNDIPQHILASVEACTIAEIKALRSLGISKDLLLALSSRWYGVHVPAGHAGQAAEALRAAELHGETVPLDELARTLTSLADQIMRALPDRDHRGRSAASRNTTERSEHLAARKRELASLGRPPRFNLYMYPLLSMDEDSGHRVLAASTPQLRRVVEKIGRQFRREGRYDVPPFHASNEQQHGVLILTSEYDATFPIAAGAAGLSQHDGWQLDWIWLHPYERGNGHIDTIWDELEERFGQFKIDGPYSSAMQRFIRRRGITSDRLTPSIPK